MGFLNNMLIVRCEHLSHRTIVFLHRLDGLLDESDFIGSEGILAIEMLVNALYGRSNQYRIGAILLPLLAAT